MCFGSALFASVLRMVIRMDIRRARRTFAFSLSALFLCCLNLTPLAVFAQEQKSLQISQTTQPTRTKIPEAQASEVEIKELKATIAVDVLASRSKVFKTKQRINRVAVSDPSVADVVLMSENQFVVIGKNPGAINVTIWCDNKAGNK